MSEIKYPICLVEEDIFGRIEKVERLLIEGKENFIVLETDCRLYLTKVPPEVTNKTMTIREFVTCFEIKDRVHENYEILKDSMKEIGASTKDLPSWEK